PPPPPATPHGPAPTLPGPAPTLPGPAPTLPEPAPTLPGPAPTLPGPAPTRNRQSGFPPGGVEKASDARSPLPRSGPLQGPTKPSGMRNVLNGLRVFRMLRGE